MSGKNNETYVISIFTDIRGFTEWSENQNVYAFAPVLIEEFYNSLKSHFKDYKIKKLGDGAMLTLETDIDKASNATNDIIKAIDSVTTEFESYSKDFARKYGQKTDLFLGWGVTRGTVKKIDGDFLGGTINRASRLCSVARPFGIVLDKYNFSDADKNRFSEESYPVKGIEKPIECLVTKEIATSFVTRELRRETPEVHVAGICFKKEHDEQIKILIAKRSKNRALYPGLYEGCGGQLKANETFENGVIRHFRTEMNITVSVVQSVAPLIYSIKKDNILINGLVYLCSFVEGTPASKNHDCCEWKTLPELDSMDDNLFIDGLKNEIHELISRYNA